MRDVNVCELFSKVCGGTISCAHPEKEKCGFTIYNVYGTNIGLCSYRVAELGFKKCYEEMEILIKWKKEIKK